MYQPKNYGEVKDFFFWVVLYAPTFDKTPYKRTLETAFETLRSGVHSVRSRMKRREAIELMDKCLVELEQTKGLYQAGDNIEAARRLQDTAQLFIVAYKERRCPKDRTPKPAYLAEEEDADVDDPEFDAP
jgi:hypothetical protein